MAATDSTRNSAVQSSGLGQTAPQSVGDGFDGFHHVPNSPVICRGSGYSAGAVIESSDHGIYGAKVLLFKSEGANSKIEFKKDGKYVLAANGMIPTTGGGKFEVRCSVTRTKNAYYDYRITGFM